MDKKDILTDWVKLYTRELYVWASKKVPDLAVVEDLVQDTFLAAAEQFAGFRGDSSPKTWLMGILKNKIAEHYRKVIRENTIYGLPETDRFFNADEHWNLKQQPQSWAGEAENLTDIPEFNKVLDACIEYLPKVMNACIRLKFINDKKGEEICRELGISSANYWQLIHRAKLQLRHCLEKYWFRAN